MRTAALGTAGRERSDGRLVSGHEPCRARPTVQEVYEAHFEFVWRSARRLGIKQPQLDDIVQEVFMVVQRRLAEFEGRSELRTWLFAITRHIARNHVRLNARRGQRPLEEPNELSDPAGCCPESQLVALESKRTLYTLLEQLDQDKREVFVLAQLEEMSGPEIARALELPLSNVYSRIVAAQRAFDRVLRRYRAQQRRQP
jgi:RNA polymerase sigma-70 factor (ECF subfamily)